MSTAPATSPLSIGAIVLPADPTSTLPLTHTEVHGQVVGALASVALTQQFANPFDRPVELLYRFAIPHQASVAGLELRVGDRRIEGEIVERDEAERLYRQVVAAGQRAALTTEERPNLYTVQLGNVLPGEGISVTYRYSMRLEVEGGRFELTLPFGVTPRYHRGDESPEDVGRTDVAIAPPGAEIGDLDVTVSIDAGVPIARPTSPSHAIDVTQIDERRCMVRLVDPRLPIKDFVLRYETEPADREVQASAWSATFDDDEYVYALFLPPPPDTGFADTLAREFVFVLDRSGSMSGEPIAQARNALRACLRTLGPRDTFRILLFDDQLEWHGRGSRTARPFTDEALAAADTFLDRVEGRGGTELLEALEAVAKLAPDPERQRIVVLLTDGAVSAEDQAARLVRERFDRSRLCCFGIGPSVNRYLLSYLAKAGRGYAEFVGLDEDIEEAIIRFQDRTSYPVVTDLVLVAADRDGVEVYPDPLPDLYAGQPLHVALRLPTRRRSEPRELRLQGRRGDEVVTLRATCVPIDDPIVRRLWVQERITSLLEDPEGEAQHAAVVELSRRHHILTPLTALIAVDPTVATDQPGHRVVVASPLPEGVTFRGLRPGVSPLSATTAAPLMASAAPPAPRLGGLLKRLIPSIRHKKADDSASGPAFTRAYTPNAESANVSAGQAPNPSFRRDHLLRALVRSQSASGAWLDDRGHPSVELTAAALVAFARAGHTLRHGMFRRPVQRGVAWLSAHAQSPLDQLFRVWAFAELGIGRTAEDDPIEDESAASTISNSAAEIADAVRTRLRRLLGKPTSNSRHGWSVSRCAAILGEPVDDAVLTALPLPWQACAVAGSD